MKISMIAAIGPNRELGKDNKLLWNIPEDLRHFRETTKGHPVIMGRKTYESIGYQLPNRLNIIISRNTKYEIPNTNNVRTVQSLEDAIELGKKAEQNEIFIIGGGQIYEQGMKYADKLYLTIVEKMPAEVEELVKTADTFFPDYSDFKKVLSEEERESGGYKYRFVELEKI